jgi:hypothetical protein
MEAVYLSETFVLFLTGSQRVATQNTKTDIFILFSIVGNVHSEVSLYIVYYVVSSNILQFCWWPKTIRGYVYLLIVYLTPPSIPQNIASNEREYVNDILERLWKEADVP